MFGFIKKIFIGLLPSAVVNTFSNAKCVSLSNQKCTSQPTLINLHPNEYTKGLCYCPFEVNLDRCVGSCSTLNGLSNKVYYPNKTENLNISVFNIIIKINNVIIMYNI